MAFTFPFMLLLLVLSGCGQVRETNSSSRKLVTYNSFSLNPVPLEKQSHDCYTKTFQSKFLPIKLFDGEDVVPFQFDYTSLLDNLFVRDQERKTILNSTYNQSSEYQVFETLAGEVKYSGKELRAGLDITVCPEEENYHEDSVENAALSVNYFINKTSKGIKEASQGLHLPPIKLSIGPLIKVSNLQERYQDIVMKSSYWVDNAAYTPGTQTIAFFPQSAEAKEAGVKTNFWLMPMVSSHEYGHHLFNQLFPLNKSSNEIHVCLDNRKLSDDALYSDQPFEVKEVINSINEGFADLVANYTLSEKEVSLKGIECMEVNRELNSASFRDGTPKIFDFKNLFYIFGHWYNSERSSCAQPDLKNIHTVGAIFANFADSYFNFYTTDKTQKLRILIEWVKLLKSDYGLHKNQNPQKYLKSSLQSFVRIVPKETGIPFKSKFCNRLEALYTGITEELQECR